MIEFNWAFILSGALTVYFAVFSLAWCPDGFFQQANRGFEQKTDRFWKFEEESNSWVEVKLPHDLMFCIDDNCTAVGSIRQTKRDEPEDQSDEAVHHIPEQKKNNKGGREGVNFDGVLPLRKSLSVTKITDTSIFVTGASGSIYQRFWNGMQWVISHHDLPVSAGYSISVFLVNQSLLALSEAGDLYQMRLSEISSPVWVDLTQTNDCSMSQEKEVTEQRSAFGIKSGVVSHDGTRIYFCTQDGSLVELAEMAPPRWVNHGQPPGVNIAKVADVATIRTEVIYTISSTGELYEFDRNSKPSWKKHIWKGSPEGPSLLPSAGWSSAGLVGTDSVSLFLLTRDGELAERRLHQRKWKWIIHGIPENHRLTSITPASQDEVNEFPYSLFFATDTGCIFEYQLPKDSGKSGTSRENAIQERWINHMHPQNAKAARGVVGMQLQVGRMVFPLDDGRLAELHLPGLGGETTGPIPQANIKRKASQKYLWSILDAPESEGWNREYCTEDRGPSNCIMGIKDGQNDESVGSVPRRRKWSQGQQSYLPPSAPGGGAAKYMEDYRFPRKWTNSNFRLRVLHEGRSFFLITDGGLAFECIYADNLWLWLRHEHSAAMEGALGNYNESIFFVDKQGSLLMREKNGNDLAWINCTAMRKGRPVISGPPWNQMQGNAPIYTPRDSLFFVSKKGRLLQFTVSLKQFEWKDCQNPPGSKVASIVDQEIFREHIVFVIGKNGRLYQYNKVTELWHEHYQSQHLFLSRLPGTAMRPSSQSLTGSLFMLSEEGGLVEYHWNALDGWNWIEHGTPDESVTLVSAPGPCPDGSQLFLIGSDGNVYLRYMDQTAWKWKNYGYPHKDNLAIEDWREDNPGTREAWGDQDVAASLEKELDLQDLDCYCDLKVAAIRPIPFSYGAVIFELRDGRLAEMRRVEETHWIWLRIIGTPTSLCTENYWIALTS